MSDGHVSARNLVKQSNVEVIITTDDPLSDLKYHELLEKENLSFKVIPCFRMDNLYNIESDGFKDYIARLSKMTGKTIETFENLIEAIKVRIDYFIKHSMVSTDISFKDIPFDASDVSNPTKSLELVFKGEELTEDDIETYHYMFLKEISKILKEKNIVMQWHVGVLRNQDSKEFVKHGRDIGRDSMGDPISVEDLNIILDDIEIEAGLPKITVYPLNPTNYYSVISSLLDYSKEVRGKLQLGAAWWFNDHENGIRAVLNAI
jgi:glucuronate isomerase